MLLVLLRVFGFVPGLVHSAWAQVAMGHAQAERRTSFTLAMLACAVIACIAALIALALSWGWLQASWQGLAAYLWPLALWQMAASTMAAHAHLPFAHGRAVLFSRQCMAINLALLVLLCLPLLWPMPAHQHLLLVSGFMTLALLAQALDHGLHRQSR